MVPNTFLGSDITPVTWGALRPSPWPRSPYAEVFWLLLRSWILPRARIPVKTTSWAAWRLLWRDPSGGHDCSTGSSTTAITRDAALRRRHDTPSSRRARALPAPISAVGGSGAHQSALQAGGARTNQHCGREQRAPISAAGGNGGHQSAPCVRPFPAATAPPLLPEPTPLTALPAMPRAVPECWFYFLGAPGLLGAVVWPFGVLSGIASALKVYLINS